VASNQPEPELTADDVDLTVTIAPAYSSNSANPRACPLCKRLGPCNCETRTPAECPDVKTFLRHYVPLRDCELAKVSLEKLIAQQSRAYVKRLCAEARSARSAASVPSGEDGVYSEGWNACVESIEGKVRDGS
jgi:hypothetical protein